jgi:hypothetical protein
MATASIYYGVHILTTSASGAVKRGVHGGNCKIQKSGVFGTLSKFVEAMISTLYLMNKIWSWHLSSIPLVVYVSSLLENRISSAAFELH